MPDMDLSTNPDRNVKYGFGKYKKIWYCGECRYFETPDTYGRQIFWRECCPNCGGISYYKRTARYKIKTTKEGLWFWTTYKSEIFGIELLKDKERL